MKINTLWSEIWGEIQEAGERFCAGMYEHHTHQERVMGMLGGLWHLKQVSGFEGEAKKERDQLSYGLSGVKSRTMREKAGWGQDLGKTGASRASLRDWKNMGDLDFEYLRSG